jgi:hypothetical protein
MEQALRRQIRKALIESLVESLIKSLIAGQDGNYSRPTHKPQSDAGPAFFAALHLSRHQQGVFT